jgi:basic amino acid/polyamine antiporter, APA family
MAERRLHGLQRVLGTNALFATAYGNVGSSIYYALGLVAASALGLTPIVFLIAGFFFFCTAATYAEGTAMYPEAGGSSSFARRAFNEFWSFFAAWGQMLNYVITVAISAFFLPHYLGGVLWEPLESSPGDLIFGVAVVGGLMALNVVGTKESTAVNVLLAVIDFLSQLALVIVGAALVFSPDALTSSIDLGVTPTWSAFILAIPLGMIAYTGIETVSNMAEEARDETKTIPAAIGRVRFAVFAIYFTLPFVALSALPVRTAQEGDLAVRNGTLDAGDRYTPLGLDKEDGGFASDPIIGVVEQLELGALQGVSEAYFGLLAATILLLATNAGLIGVSRLVYSMGVHRQLPDGLRRLHPKFGTPWIGILIFGAVSMIALLPGQATFLGNMYAFGAMLSFTIAHVSLLRLRFTHPDVERPYRAPLNVRFRGTPIPLLAVIGGTGTALAFLVVTILNPAIGASGAGWLALGVLVYFVYRRRQGLDLTTTHKVAIPQPVVDHEAEYDSVLVAMSVDDGYDEQVMATATKLAARKRHGIHVLVTVPVPYALAVGDPMPEAEAAAQSIIEQARVRGGRRCTGHYEKVRAAQAGRRIVEEAEDMRASAIVMSLPRRVAGASLFGKTLETVLSHRPCRVIIESSPADAAQRAAADLASNRDIL